MKISALPNLIIIGAMRAGTTSLHSYLNAHPQIAMSRHKELNFFMEHPEWPGSWHKGQAWYASHFDGNVAVRGEASPSYANFPQFQEVPERMHAVIPEAKLIYIVRDPVARLISDYRLLLVMGYAPHSLESMLENMEIDLVSRSCYYRQLERYLPFYRKEQIHVVSFEELRDARVLTLRAIFEFLQVDSMVSSPHFEAVLNASRSWMPRNDRERAMARCLTRLCYRFPFWQNAVGVLNRWDKRLTSPALAAALKASTSLSESRLEELKEYLRPDIEHFRMWAGRDFPQWSV